MSSFCLFCSVSYSVLVFSASWQRWTLLSGHLFFGAKNSESCLIECRIKFNERIFGSISKLDFV
ncbi:hypothetical protein CGJ00_23620 [Vibrio parahaemolyticus]|nr:hypothetical protein CGJ00_23620 [Vibrio parahaemolyticus]